MECWEHDSIFERQQRIYKEIERRVITRAWEGLAGDREDHPPIWAERSDDDLDIREVMDEDAC